MRYLLSITACLLSFCGFAQNVGINNPTPDASAQLDIVSSSKGLLIPRMSQLFRQSITLPANGLIVYQTDGNQGLYYNSGTPAAPTWIYLAPPANSWNIGGNSLLATGSFGTTSNNHVDLISNNIIRGRLSNLGEFFIGATNTTIPGDLMAAVGNATFPFATNGYSAFNGSGVYGAVISGSTTQFAGVQGEYQSTIAGIFNTAGVRGSNQSGTAGTGYRTQAATGPRVGVIGNTTITNGQYTFGVHGSMNSTDIRCGGLFGDDFGIALGAVAYYASTLVDYSMYGFGSAYQTGLAGGRSSLTEPNTHIGLGIYGGVMGGWVRGLVYGAHVKGDRYSLYVDGRAYTNEPVTELVPMADGSRMPAYSLSTLQPQIIARGKASLQQGRMQVKFDEAFAAMASTNPDDLVITVSPLGPSKGLYIAAQDGKGFTVQENENAGTATQFSWIAIATRKGMEQMNHAPELLEAGFDRKMNNVMFNDNNTKDTPQPIWWDGKQVRFDNPPPRQADPQYKAGVRVKE